eukprot:CAMPEP_0183725344 /NCGR_PEP_ID=MMETSP0737-20130205/20286_1 /TAXON_ID=385413 /ORGANISM="Thalassiosira miniscula, Strain CCMP1093" /LENGTH=36 /DNA_ID= /DNA_START= /DNA_END= /DNA_ORIENTATION=
MTGGADEEAAANNDFVAAVAGDTADPDIPHIVFVPY